MNDDNTTCKCKVCRVTNPTKHKLDVEQVYEKFGSKCFFCDEEYDESLPISNLQLDHIYYVEGNGKNHRQLVDTLTEAMTHPYRFRLLCKTCHKLRTILQYEEEKLHQFFKIFYLRQFIYTYPYNHEIKTIGKSWIFFKGEHDCEFDYLQPNDLNPEFAKYYFPNKNELYKEFARMKVNSLDCGIAGKIPICDRTEKSLKIIKDRIINQLIETYWLYDGVVDEQPDFSQIKFLFNLLEDFIKKPELEDEIEIEVYEKPPDLKKYCKFKTKEIILKSESDLLLTKE